MTPPAVEPVDPRALPYTSEAVDALRPRAKQALRARYRAVRAALTPDARAARSAALTTALTSQDFWATARTVAVFSALSDELDTAGLIADARARGITVALPVVLPDTPVMVFRTAVGPGQTYELTRGVWGIAEPVASAPVVPPGDLDVVVIPALAVDPRGFRLGYGRGFYDHTLPLAPRAVRVAVVFDFQLIAEVPEQTHDVPVEWVVTDRRVLRATHGRGGEAPLRPTGESP